MPRKHRNTKKKNQSLNVQTQVCRTPFRVLFSQVAPNNSTAFQPVELNLNISQLGARVVALGDTFTQFRITKLKVESIGHNFSLGGTGSADTQGSHYIAFTATDSTYFATTTTLALMADFPCFEQGNVFHKISFTVGPSALYEMTPTKWYNTSTVGAHQSAGTIIYAVENGIAISGVQLQQVVMVEGMLEFKGPVDPALVPLSYLEKQLAELQDQIDKRTFLSTSIPSPTPSVRRFAPPQSKLEEKKVFLKGSK